MLIKLVIIAIIILGALFFGRDFFLNKYQDLTAPHNQAHLNPSEPATPVLQNDSEVIDEANTVQQSDTYD